MARTATIPKEAWIPTDYTEKLTGENSEVYLYTDASGQPCATGFVGKRSKPDLNYRYQSEERRAEHVKRWMEGIAETQQWKRDRKAERQAYKHTLKVGDILYSSWGYDQTNIDFYEVTRVTAKSAEIRKLAQTQEVTGFMSGTTEPKPGEYTGEAKLKRVGPDNVISIASYAVAVPWDGKPKHNSWYA
jgi:hypothetical protein